MDENSRRVETLSGNGNKQRIAVGADFVTAESLRQFQDAERAAFVEHRIAMANKRAANS